MLTDLTFNSEKRTGLSNSLVSVTNHTYIHPSNYKLYSNTIQLSGHKDEIFCGKFSKDGLLFATAGVDKNINIWDTFDKQCKNISVLQGHNNAIMDIAWTTNNKIISSSADKSIFIWDIYQAKRLKKLSGHNNIVNSCDVSTKGDEIIASAGEDCNFMLWDLRTKKEILKENLKYQLTAIRISSYGTKVYIGGIENKIYCYDTRNNMVEGILEGHVDTVTGLSLSNDETKLLSYGMDGQVIIWNLYDYLDNNKVIKVFQGTKNNIEKNLIRCAWSSDDRLISCGSADKHTYIWNYNTEKLIHKLPGHNGTVNDVDFNSITNVISSVSSDKTAILGEY